MAPESVPWLLAGGVFLASTLQSASGIGFGGVVGPLIMISMRSSAAAQVSIVLSFVIALALAPAMLRRVDMPLLKQLVLGALIGVQLGNAAFAALSLPALEWAAAAITAFNIAPIPRWTRWRSSRSPAAQQRLVGAIPGALSSALAMPGPAVAAHLDATDRDKNAIRSATVALFLWSYPIEYAAQALLAQPSGEALKLSAALLPAVLLGVPVGAWLTRYISERQFKSLGVVVMAATSTALVVSALRAV